MARISSEVIHVSVEFLELPTRKWRFENGCRLLALGPEDSLFTRVNETGQQGNQGFGKFTTAAEVVAGEMAVDVVGVKNAKSFLSIGVGTSILRAA